MLQYFTLDLGHAFIHYQKNQLRWVMKKSHCMQGKPQNVFNMSMQQQTYIQILLIEV